MWKWFLYSLVLINIGFFAWSSRSGIPLVQVNPNDDLDDAVRLLLLKEQPSKTLIESENTEKALACFSVGPFVRKTEARAAKKRLGKWNIQAKRRALKTSTKGFWVIILPSKTRKAARRKIKKIKELGIKDYFLVATGAQKNAVSLGVFSKSSSARRRLKEMQRKGVEAQIIGVDLPKRSYWLDWLASGHVLTANQLDMLQKTFKGVGKVTLNCSIKSML